MTTITSWLFSRERSGATTMLERPVTGIAPSELAPERPAPPPLAGRRERQLRDGTEVVAQTVSAKILHGWLQNRHQTLFPLTLNLRTLEPAQSAALARWMAVVAQAGAAGQPEAARAWLVSAGADAQTLAVLDAAFATPPALHTTLEGLLRHDLAAYGYVLALVGIDRQDPAADPFLDYVAARLALPTNVVRSAVRRYRR